MNHKSIGRKIPTRVSYVAVASVLYLATPWVIKLGGLSEHSETVYTALMAIIGLITAAIGGDTVRPSGMVKAEQEATASSA